LQILLGAAVTWITAWCLGKSLLHVLRLRLYRFEEDLFAFLTGSAILSMLVCTLCSIHLARRGVFTMICLACVTVAFWRGWLVPARERLPRPPGVWPWLFAVPFTVYTCLYFFNALAPQIDPGPTGYHLGNVVRWWVDRGFSPDFVPHGGSAFANLPQGLEMLFLFAFPFGKHSAAVLVEFTFWLALPLLMLCYGRRFGMVRPMVLGAVFVYLSPAGGLLGTSASNDAALACVMFGSFYMLELWDAGDDHRLLGLAGFLAGFGFAISYAGGLGLAGLVAFAGWRVFRERRSAARPLIILACAAAISIAPWMVKNWLSAGNPFSPFLNRWFPNASVHVSAEAGYATTLGFASTIPGIREAVLAWSLQGTTLQGVFGPWLLLTPLSILAARWKHGRRLLLAAAVLGVAAIVGKAFALVLPFAVFAAPAIGLAVENTPGMIPLLVILQCFVSWPQAVEAYTDKHARRFTDIPVVAALRKMPEEQFLLSHLDGYAAARAIEKTIPSGAKVLALWPVPQAHTTRLIFDRSESATGELAWQSILTAFQSITHPLSEIRFRFRRQSLRKLRVVATESGDQLWTVHEMRVYSDGTEIARRPEWRISAAPNAQDAPRAFDNSEVTAWSPWEVPRPNMYLEEDFDSSVEVDQVLVLGNHAPRLRIDGLDDRQAWRALNSTPEVEAHLAPPGQRRSAADDLKTLGFGYLVVRDDEGVGRDMLRYPSYWGLTRLEEIGDLCVFRLD
jgi:hypothetical protein